MALADGRTLTTWTWGAAGPVVVLEAGIGLGGRSWAPVARVLASRATVVAYDRAGHGTSAPDPSARTLDRLAADLRHVVEATAAPGAVLVGHSWGGVIARRAVEDLPEGLVTGLVLVDPADEGARAYFTRRAALATQFQALALPLLARTGVLRAGLRRSLAGRLDGDDLLPAVEACSSRAAAVTAAGEHAHLRDGLRQVAATCPGLPGAVLSGTRGAMRGSARGQLVEAQRVRAAACGLRWVEATGSGHLVQLDQPRLVADEVLRLLG